MKKALALCCMLLLPNQVATAASAPGTLSWSVVENWRIDTKPVDFAQSLDGRTVFVLGEDSQVYLYSFDGDKLGSIPVDKSTVALDIAPRGEMLYLVDSNSSYKALDISFVQDIDITGSPFLGKAEAPVAIVVFSDFQCPYCSKIHPLLEEVMQKNPDTVKVVFKHLPLQMHKQAEPAARAAIAAHEQSKFWPMHDALFAASKQLSPEVIKKAAAGLGLDMEKFKADWNSEATKQKLVQDIGAARKAEVNGTPTLFVNGRRVKGPGGGTIQKMIDQELSKK